MTKLWKDNVMWRCPRCDRLIPDFVHQARQSFDKCPCGTWFWEFNKFPLDMDDVITVNIGHVIEKAYRDGYSRGYEEGDENGYTDGYDEGYRDNQ